MKLSSSLLLLMGALMLTSCHNHYYYPHVTYSNEPVTLGTVQRKLRKGMGQDSVAYALGSPNIVTKDKFGREAWIYDKQSSDLCVSESSSGMWLIIGSTQSETKKQSSSQKSLTIIVKFDEQSLVDHISYHTTEF